MSIFDGDARIAVSSVLNRDVKQYGKKYMFDGNDDTCWNSDQGNDQWIQIAFPKEKTLNKALTLKIQFQGGFSCKVISVILLDEDQGEVTSTDCYPEDVNSIQYFELLFPCEDNPKFNRLKLLFKDSTDFFGRITIYCLDIKVH